MNKKYLVVTSFSENGYSKYAKNFLEAFDKFWEPSIDLLAFHHSEFRQDPWVPSLESFGKLSDRVIFSNLDEVPNLIPFKESAFNLIQQHLNQHGQPTTSVPWQLDAVKFTNKVFALAVANGNFGDKYEYIIWLDADTVTTQPVTEEFLNQFTLTKPDIVHLGRSTTTYSETSFLMFRTCEPKARVFIDNLIGVFLNGEFRFYAEWHDGFIFERLLNLHKMHGLNALNISPNPNGLDAFGTTPLASCMVHLKGNKKELIGKQPQPQKIPDKVAFKVNPQDCVEDEQLKSNIEENLTLINRWVCMGKITKDKAVFASAGPSLKKNLKKIKDKQANGEKIFCVKHSYPTLLEAGIIPDFCVILDPREMDGVSTHGIIRKDLFKEFKGTTFLIASMTHPSVTKYFLSNGCNVVGWHAAISELKEVISKHPEINPKFLQAPMLGTCSAIRGIGLVDLLGFKTVSLYGFDSSFDGEPEGAFVTKKDGKQKYFWVTLDQNGSTQPFITNPSLNLEGYHKPLEKGERGFWSTGELVALYQDFITCIPFYQKSLKIEFTPDKNYLIGEGWSRLIAHEKAQKEAIKNLENQRKKSDTWDKICNHPPASPNKISKT